MSLVAYGSSDDSGGSDVEDNEPVVSAQVPTGSSATTAKVATQIEKAEPAKDAAVNNTSDLISDSESDTEVNGNNDDEKSTGLSEASAENAIEETDELEDEVKPKASQVSDIAKPVPKKSKQPVKITIPALPDLDDDEPVKKKAKPAPSTGKFGLTSVLPPPMHAAKKESNRILLPYSLTKRTVNPAKPVAKPSSGTGTSDVSKVNSITTSLANYGSDSDDDDDNSAPVNFFSLDATTNIAAGKTAAASTSIFKEAHDTKIGVNNSLVTTTQDVGSNFVGPSLPPTQSTSIVSSVTESDPSGAVQGPSLGPMRGSLHLPAPIKSTDNSATIDNEIDNESSSNQEMVTSSYSTEDESIAGSSLTSFAPTADADAPLMFKGGKSSSQRKNSSDMVGPSLPTDGDGYSNMAYSGNVHYPEVDSLQAFQQDDDFLRLQGKKQRGKEEINIIDVNADDYTDPTEITKHLTEEQSYQSHRKSDNQPSTQQRKKHQIGYLAFQAKERELELKNQWSQNKQTRKQTQAKYGF